jgi:cytochrome c peroxidase
MKSGRILSLIAFASLIVIGSRIEGGTSLPNPARSVNGNGTLSTLSTGERIDMSGEFFQSIGTNGRTCGSCHVVSSAFGITPSEVQARFNSTKGEDPIFRTNDGANCPSADVSTFDAKRSAYSMLLEKGLIRVSLPVPPSAEFQIIHIDDPHNCPQTTASAPALYRRPLPSTNLAFLTTVMWDGRESAPGKSLRQNLEQQAIDATTGHAEGFVPNAEQVKKIVDFEMAIYTAQASSFRTGMLDQGGGEGGAEYLSKQEFYEGINDVLGADPKGKPFDPVAFTTYRNWKDSRDPHKASVARGEALFNTFPIMITGVKGLNDLPGLSVVNGSCTTCHDSPNVGNHSVPLAIDIGITDYPAMPALDTSGLPVYTVQCISTGQITKTTDLGRAMVTGRCADIGKTKGPILRGLEARAPYFHNGGAKTLGDAVEFYNQRFNMNLNDQQKQDLVAFLRTL